MSLKIIIKPVSIADLWKGRTQGFDELLKAVVDIEKGIMAVDAEMHSDLEALLLESGSRQSDIWGINLYPSMDPVSDAFIEFTSFINIRPAQDNKSMEVLNPAVRQKIRSIVHALLI
jgi:hypothetical protein